MESPPSCRIKELRRDCPTNITPSNDETMEEDDGVIIHHNNSPRNALPDSKSYQQVSHLIESNYCPLGNTVKLTKAVWSINRNNMSCYAVKDGILVGYLGVALFEVTQGNVLSNHTTSNIGYVNYLCVDQTKRNQGLAKAMITKLQVNSDILGYCLSEIAQPVAPTQLGVTKSFSHTRKNWFRPLQAKRAQQLGYVWDIPKLVSARSTKGVTSLNGYYKVNKEAIVTIAKITTIDQSLYDHLSRWNSKYIIYLSINGLIQLCQHFDVYLIRRDNQPAGLIAGHVTPVRIKEGSWFNNFYIVYTLGQAEICLNALMCHLDNIVCLYMVEGGFITSEMMDRIKACRTTNLSHLTMLRTDRMEQDKINLPVF